MTEKKIYEDDFACSFRDRNRFLEFLKERKENSFWLKAPSRRLRFQSVEKDSSLGDLYMQFFRNIGKAGILEDTMENTSILLSVNGSDYPVRSCALKTILERARISGNALSKVPTRVFTEILNYCMDVASGDSLIKVADEKVSAVHGGDPKDYAVLDILPLFQRVKDFLDTYRREVAAKGLAGKTNVLPALRFTTSDVGVSGANLYPILLMGKSSRIVPLGYPIKTNHKNGVDMDYFNEQLSLLYARFREAIEEQTKLLDIDVRYPATAMLGVLKRIGAPKKASYEALDQFLAQHGDIPCSAYELYLAMSEVIFISQCEGASGGRIAQLEEIVARALHVDWQEYDRPGDFVW